MPSKTTIAFVANTSWSIYKFRLSVIKMLLEKGFTVCVLAPEDKYTALFRELPGLVFVGLEHFDNRNISPGRDIRLYRELLQHYRRLQPDLVFHYTIKANIFGSLAAARSGSGAISVITGLGYAFSNGWLLRTAATLLYRFALAKNAETWFLNRDDEDFFTRRRMVPRGRSFLLPGEGIDTGIFYPAPYDTTSTDPGDAATTVSPETTIAPNATTGKTGETTIASGVTTGAATASVTGTNGLNTLSRPAIFLLLARLIRGKGIEEFAEAAGILRQKGLPVECRLLGFFDGENQVSISGEELKEWADKKRITYLGETDDVVPFIAQADCIVLPSYGEGMPLSLLEGASMCKALIASDTAGCREIVTDGINGFLCRPKDAADLAARMEKYLFLSPEEKKEMGLAGREKVSTQFRTPIVTAIYLEKITAVLT